MKKVLLSALLLIYSCGKLVDPVNHDSRFDPVKEQFEKDAQAFGLTVDTSDIAIAFGDTRKKIKYAGFLPLTRDPGPSYGYCLVLGKTNNDLGKPLAKMALGKRHNSKIILISNDLRNFPAKDIEATVYHELGHCALNFGHKENQLLMSTSFNGNMDNFRYFLLKELFTDKSEMPPVLMKSRLMDQEMELIYEADYEFLNERIFYRLFFHPIQKKYYFINAPVY